MTYMPSYSFRCGNCSMPIEFCEFSNDYEKCKEWLDKKLQKLVSSSTSVSGKSKKKEEAPEYVRVRRVVKPGQKLMTIVDGLLRYGVDLDYACHLFAGVFQKVSKVIGMDRISISGDVMIKLRRLIPYYWPHIDNSSVVYEKEVLQQNDDAKPGLEKK